MTFIGFVLYCCSRKFLSVARIHHFVYLFVYNSVNNICVRLRSDEKADAK